MYYEYFGLRDAPFQFLPSNTLFLSGAHLEGLAALQWAFQEPSGLTLLVGEVGSGKTMLIHALVTRLKDDHIRVGQISNPTMSFEEMLDVLVQELQIHPVGKGKRAALQALKTFVGDPASKDRVILIFDEAQGLSDETLEELRLLSNTRPPQRHALQIILVGQPELAQRLTDPKLRALNQRIGARAVLRPLRGQEVGDYVNWLLRAQGASRELFTREAMDRVARLSGGLPRKINNLCHNSLFAAYAQRSSMVEPAHVQTASAELENLLEASERIEPGILGWRSAMNWMVDKGKPLVAGGVLVLAVVAGAMVLESGTGHPNAPSTNSPASNGASHTELAQEAGGSSDQTAPAPEKSNDAAGNPADTDAPLRANAAPNHRAERLAQASAAPASQTAGPASQSGGTVVAMAPRPAPHAEPGAQPPKMIAPPSSIATRPVPAPAAQAARSGNGGGSTTVSGPIPQPQKAQPGIIAAARPPQPARESSSLRFSHVQQRRLQYEARRARTSFGQGRYLNAIYHSKRALVIDPDNAEMRETLERAEAAQGIPRRSTFIREQAVPATDDDDNTADAATEVPRRSSYSGVIRYEISQGDAYMRAGKYDLALRKFLTAAVLDPDDADLNQRIARARGAKAVLDPNSDSTSGAVTADPRPQP